jgi:hypothetical protein
MIKGLIAWLRALFGPGPVGARLDRERWERVETALAELRQRVEFIQNQLHALRARLGDHERRCRHE